MIDTTFDVRTDARGRDPDSHSSTLRRYHQLLWSKPLPGGEHFALDSRLHHSSRLGEFWLASDAITHTYLNWTRPAPLVRAISEIPEAELTAFYDLGCTVGAYLVFPTRKQVDGVWRMSINQQRGVHPRIRDRFDLTLECIRLHYSGIDSPLARCLSVYQDFFALFGSFSGYVRHFLLEDLVDDATTSVKFLAEHSGFDGDPFPIADAHKYRAYMSRSMDFIRSRNERIASFARTQGV
ncbi:MAG: hypothetical protein U0Q15_15680 [Kineosporiaceae bacterium]